MRISDRSGLLAVAAMLLIVSCRRGGNADQAIVSGPNDPAAIACQPAYATFFAKVCRVDEQPSARGVVLTIEKPDGGFRRLLVLPGGRGLVAADGAELAMVTEINDHQVEVLIGGDRFRLDAKLPPRLSP